MRKLLVSGIVAATAVLGCAGAALAEAGNAGTTGTAGAVNADGPAGAAIARLAGSANTADRLAAFRLERLLAQRPQASGTGSLYLAGGLSCGTPSDCLAIGMAGNAHSGPLKPAVERLHAGAWKSVPVKVPVGAVMADLGAVSCKAATYCLVVGQSLSDLPPVGGNGLTPLVLSWNGTALTRVAAPPAPKADAVEEILGVSCVAVGQCVVTGVGSAKASGDTVQFVWTLNGATWKVTAIPEPGTGGGSVPPPTGPGAASGTRTLTNTTFAGLRCFTLTSCVATGETDVITGSGPGTSITITPLAASWNGTAFTSLNAPVPSGTSDAMFEALSCVSPHACALDGVAADKTSADALGFAEVWNGKTWAVTKWAGPKGGTDAELLGVSCTRADRCIAVGEHGSGTTSAPAALAWSGSKWKLLSVPGAGKGKTAVFATVSCPLSGWCVATGETGTMTKSSPALVPLAGYFHHTAWTYGPMFPAA
jgi:hypothetical protein